MSLITDVTNVIKTAKQKQDFINHKKLYEICKKYKVKLLLEITPKGIGGKSTGWGNILIDNVKKGFKNKKPFEGVWVRNTLEEFKQSNVRASFTRWLMDKDFDMNHWLVNNNGVYYKQNAKSLHQLGRLYIMFASMNTIENLASQNSMKAQLVIYDELINPRFNKPNLTYLFYLLLSTAQRLENCLSVLLANAHDNSNDIINELGIQIDWTSGKDQVIWYEDTRILAIYVGRYVNKYSKEADDSLNKLFKNSETVQNFINGRVAFDRMWNVKSPNMITDFNNKFVPKWIYDFNDTTNKQISSFCVGTLDNFLYIKYLDPGSSYDNIKHLCYRPIDKTPTNIYIWDIENYSTVELLLNYYSANKLWFSKTYDRDVFIRIILPHLKILLEEQEK